MQGTLLKGGLKGEQTPKIVYKRQRTLPIDNTPTSSGDKRNDRFTIKNLFFNVKLKARAQKLLSILSTRRWKSLKAEHFKLIGDKSYCWENSKDRNSYITNNNNKTDDEEDEEERHENINTEKFIRFPTKSIQNKPKSASKRIALFCKALAETIPIINPNSLYKLFWDSINSVIILFMSIIVPIQIAVQDYSLSYYLGSSESLVFCMIFFLVDMVISLNTAFFQRGRIEMNRFEIIKNYAHSAGLQDILIIQALFYQINFENYDSTADGDWRQGFEYIESGLLCVLFYQKVLKLHKFMFKIEETFSFKRRTLNILSLVKLLLFILNVSHGFACIWLFIGRQLTSNGTISWMKGMENDSWISQYLQAYYFISVTMTTIGYGDIVPKNAVETIACIFIMIIACVIFGYTINSVGSIFMELKKEDEEKKENLLVINRYMNEKSISRELQSSTREYLEYFWKQQSNDNSEKEHHILGQLSEDMRQSLLLQAYRIILEDCQFFQKNFSQNAIQKSIHLIKEKKLTPYEILVGSQEEQNKNGLVFFVESGKVDIYQEFALDRMLDDTENMNPHYQKFKHEGNQTQMAKKKRMKLVQTLRKGDYFGEVSFFTNLPNKFIARSRNFSKVLYIERSKFIDFLQSNHFQEDFETFCYFRDALLQNEMSCLQQKCAYCGSFDHSPLNCQCFHFYPLRTIAISRYNYSQQITVRKYVIRRKVAYKNSFADIARTEQCASRFQVKNESFIEEKMNFFKILDSMTSPSSSSSSLSSSSEKETVLPELKGIKTRLKSTNLLLRKSTLEECLPIKDGDNTHPNLEVIQSIPTLNETPQLNDSKDLLYEVNKTKSPQIASTNLPPKKRSGLSESQLAMHLNLNRFLDTKSNETLSPNIQPRIIDSKYKRKSVCGNNFFISQVSQQQHALKSAQTHSQIEFPSLKTKHSIQQPSIVTSEQIEDKQRTYSSNLQEPKEQDLNHPMSTLAQPKKPHHTSSLTSKNLLKQSDEKQAPSVNVFQPSKNPMPSIEQMGNFSSSQKQIQTTLFLRWDAKFESGFDTMKIFKNYFPSYNYDKVLLKIKKKRQIDVNLNKPISKWARAANRNKSYTIVCNLLNDARNYQERRQKLINTSQKLISASPLQEKVNDKTQIDNNNKQHIISQLSQITTPTEIDANALSPMNEFKTTLTTMIDKKAHFLPLKSPMNPRRVFIQNSNNNHNNVFPSISQVHPFDDDDFCFSSSKLSAVSPQAGGYQQITNSTKIPLSSFQPNKINKQDPSDKDSSGSQEY